MRPSRVTLVFSTTNSPAPEQAKVPRCTMCQSVIEPSSAEYWHIGETTTRFGSVMPPRSMGVKSLGCGNLNPLPRERFSQCFCEKNGIRLIAVQAERVGGDRHALAAQAHDDA